MEVNNILQIMEAFENSSVAELDFQEGNQRIKLSKNSCNSSADEKTVSNISVSHKENINTSVGNTSISTETKVAKDNNCAVVKAPLVGTFYAAKSEGMEPFVHKGDHVKSGQVLGIIEAMKLMNEVTSEYDGVIEEILVENDQLVEFGQEMFKIRQ